MAQYVYYSELYHHGILGQKWGVRRYQNYDGSLTSAGKSRYGSGSGNKKWTSAPEGNSISVQSARMQKEYKLKNAQSKEEKKQLKSEIKEDKAKEKELAKEYDRFKKDMHKLVGNTKNIEEIYDEENNQYIYRNKRTGKQFEEFEFQGAFDYEQARSGELVSSLIKASEVAAGAYIVEQILEEFFK